MDLNILWFILITVLFIGFFFLEGFDYGVGILSLLIGHNDDERRLLLYSIAPVWDGNEVWMITAGGALFAAFPHVYATMFSTFYMALFLMLLALIMRGVAFELRGKHTSAGWRRFWDGAIFFGSAVPAFLWGVAVTNLLIGLPINSHMIYMGSFWDLLTPYTIIGGLTFLFVFTFHGAAFLTLRLVEGGMTIRIRHAAQKIGLAAIVFFVLCMILTYAQTDLFKSTLAVILLFLAAATFIAAYISTASAKYLAGFILSSLAIVFTTAAFFAGLFPRLMVSSLRPEWSLTIYNASSTPYTLSIMSVAAGCFVPLVIAYQIWTYWIFRKRLSPKDLEH
ncbi:MAG: cytochrome d ubiquinol oxidase subunit II [Selenomonadaceae bacterium]